MLVLIPQKKLVLLKKIGKIGYKEVTLIHLVITKLIKKYQLNVGSKFLFCIEDSGARTHS